MNRLRLRFSLGVSVFAAIEGRGQSIIAIRHESTSMTVSKVQRLTFIGSADHDISLNFRDRSVSAGSGRSSRAIKTCSSAVVHGIPWPVWVISCGATVILRFRPVALGRLATTAMSAR